MSDLSETQKKSIDLATEAVKQVLALATGTLALTVTFAKDLGSNGISRPFLFGSWLLLTASIFLGVFALGGLTASVVASDTDFKLKSNVKKPLRWQGWTFFLGMVLMIVFGFLAILSPKGTEESPRPRDLVFLGATPDSATAIDLQLSRLGETRPYAKGSLTEEESDPRLVDGRPTAQELVRGNARCGPQASLYLAIGGADSDPLVATKSQYGENLQLAYSRAVTVARLLSAELETCPRGAQPPVIALPRGPESLSATADRKVQADDRTVRLYGFVEAP